jgi:hypothetical protein
MRSSEEKSYILAFHPELVAVQLTLMDTVSVMAGSTWVGLFLDSGGHPAKPEAISSPNHSFNIAKPIIRATFLRPVSQFPLG